MIQWFSVIMLVGVIRCCVGLKLFRLLSRKCVVLCRCWQVLVLCLRIFCDSDILLLQLVEVIYRCRMFVFRVFMMFCGLMLLFSDLDILWLCLFMVKLWVRYCLYGVCLLIVMLVSSEDWNQLWCWFEFFRYRLAGLLKLCVSSMFLWVMLELNYIFRMLVIFLQCGVFLLSSLVLFSEYYMLMFLICMWLVICCISLMVCGCGLLVLWWVNSVIGMFQVCWWLMYQFGWLLIMLLMCVLFQFGNQFMLLMVVIVL